MDPRFIPSFAKMLRSDVMVVPGPLEDVINVVQQLDPDAFASSTSLVAAVLALELEQRVRAIFDKTNLRENVMYLATHASRMIALPVKPAPRKVRPCARDVGMSDSDPADSTRAQNTARRAPKRHRRGWRATRRP
jgi:hypothetical protein